MTKTILSALILTGSLLAGSPALAGTIDPAMVSYPCAGCHGTDGASAGQAPVIGGLPESYIRQTMINYKNGTRHSTVMGRLAKGYSPAQINAMATFFASKPWVNGKEEIDASLVDKGQQLHRTKGCLGCHGPNGISPNPTTPRLAGQYSEYLVIQMKDYMNPSMPVPPVSIPMRMMLKGMSEQDLRALAHFYASQR